MLTSHVFLECIDKLVDFVDRLVSKIETAFFHEAVKARLELASYRPNKLLIPVSLLVFSRLPTA